MKKIINTAGEQAIREFVMENLSANITEQVVQSYIDMAYSRMLIHGELPDLEISMCFSLTGETEYLQLEAEDMTYADELFENLSALENVFGKEVAIACEQGNTNIMATYDGYSFQIHRTFDQPEGFLAHCIGLQSLS